MKRINLTIATDISGQGGIATVLQVLKQGGFFTTTDSKLISSHVSGSKYKLLLVYFTALLQLIYYCVFFDVGVVHVHMASRGSYTRKSIILRLSQFLGVKTIIHLHGGGFENFYNKECSERKKQHIRATFNLADKIIVLSKSSIQWVNTIIENVDKACIVYNASPQVDLPERSTKQKNILFLGLLNQNKGVGDLIDSFAKIAGSHSNIRLQLAGDGDIERYRTQATKLGINNRVDFLGWISGLSKNQCLANATVYCLPSYYEALPMGILEAMSANVVVVATTVGGIPDVIENGKEGVLVEAGNVDALATALSTVLENDELRAKYVNAAKKKYLQSFSPSIIVPQLINIYKELLEVKE